MHREAEYPFTTQSMLVKLANTSGMGLLNGYHMKLDTTRRWNFKKVSCPWHIVKQGSIDRSPRKFINCEAV